VYGDPEEHPQTEEYWGRVNPNGVRSCYDESKRFGEALTAAYVRAKGVDARIVRIFNTYGPNSRPNDGRMVPNFICQALQGQPMTIYGRGEQTRSLCFVSDTVAGIRSALETDLRPGEVINLGNPEERTVMDCARAISAACGAEFRAEYMDTPIDDPSRRCPDISKAKRLLGWEPSTPLDQGLESTVTWFRTRLGISDQKDSALPAFS
jgi:dTDP-glucose 4,6-dehydratase/UDP-glucuronate decarboxylase